METEDRPFEEAQVMDCTLENLACGVNVRGLRVANPKANLLGAAPVTAARRPRAIRPCHYATLETTSGAGMRPKALRRSLRLLGAHEIPHFEHLATPLTG